GLTFAADGGDVASLTWSELAVASLRVAGGFARLGVQPGDRVLVQLPNCLEAVCAWFGLARLGAIFVPANPALTVRELAHAVSDSDAAVAVARSETAAALAAAGVEGIVLVDDGSFAELGAGASLADPPALEPETPV